MVFGDFSKYWQVVVYLSEEAYDFCLSRSKTKYIENNFNKKKCISSLEVKVEDHVMHQVTQFKHLGHIM